MPLLGDLIQAIVYVQQMDLQVRFYRDILELAVGFPAGLADYSAETWVTFRTGRCTLALHAGAVEPPNSSTAMHTFYTQDIHTARAALLAKGLLIGEVFEAAPGTLVCHFVDPENNPLALEQILQP